MNEILESRGDSAYWYKRSTACLKSWERCNTVNGTTLAQLRKLIRKMNWRVFSEFHKPLGSVGRRVSGRPFARIIGKLFLPFTYLPGLQELFIHRITFIAEK